MVRFFGVSLIQRRFHYPFLDTLYILDSPRVVCARVGHRRVPATSIHHRNRSLNCRRQLQNCEELPASAGNSKVGWCDELVGY